MKWPRETLILVSDCILNVANYNVRRLIPVELRFGVPQVPFRYVLGDPWFFKIASCPFPQKENTQLNLEDNYCKEETHLMGTSFRKLASN